MDIVEITPLLFNPAQGCLYKQDNNRSAQERPVLSLLLLRPMAEHYATVRDILEKHHANQHNDSFDCLVRVISH